MEGIPGEKRRMFGAPCYFAKGSMFAGVFAEDVFIRLDEEGRSRFADENRGARPFEPMPGRRMSEYLVVPDPLLRDRDMMRKWLRLSHDYAQGLKG